jgi:uncharacterized membrane protein YagU involved in acid resistance
MLNIVACLVAGALGTGAMTFVLFVPTWMGWGRIDVVRAVGSFVSHDRDHALWPGLALHFSIGILFAFVYWGVLAAVGLPLNVLTGIHMGAIHGIVIMLLVAIAILEHHPLQQYRDRGPMTGVAQVLGHVVYGGVVGAVYQLMM